MTTRRCFSDVYKRQVGIQDVADIMNYIVFDRPNAKTLKQIIGERYPDNTHPRMVADRGDFERMKQLTQTNELAKKWSDEIIAAAEAYVKKDFEPISYREGGARMGGLLDRDMITDLYLSLIHI